MNALDTNVWLSRTEYDLPADPRMHSNQTTRYIEDRTLEDAMNVRAYLANRVAFPLSELAKHSGEWVAWSPDGSRLVAAARDPDDLDDLIRAAGEDPEQCLIEGIPELNCVLGGLDAHGILQRAP